MNNTHPANPKSPVPVSESFAIVGVGASAGGLEAFSTLLAHLPVDTGMGFVLVQHLAPDHDSALPQLLARKTSLPVHEVTNNRRVEPNQVYVIPPNTSLGIEGGLLTLQPRPQTRAPHRSIDGFLEALARDQGHKSIGVILSGTASDGTLGLEAIRAEGGITFAQDGSARYDSMPNSAIAAGCVDYILAPAQIANELARIAKHPALTGTAAFTSAPAPAEAEHSVSSRGTRGMPGSETDPPGVDQALSEVGAEGVYGKILRLLRVRSGVDFSLYRPATIQRRITRRMVLSKQDSLEAYARLLLDATDELNALYQDVLINVTSFFRNPEAFDVLSRTVWPDLLKNGDGALRAWVVGCSTGEEAYSIAMTFMETAGASTRNCRLQVFATDLNEVLLNKARQGLYPRSAAENLSPARLRRFFNEESGGYRISKALRETVVFTRQNVINDPPFSRLDLISCRNLLIYLQPDLQRKVFPVFHYALKPGGYLYLGASESIGPYTELFDAVDKKHKIFARKAAPTPTFRLPVSDGLGEASSSAPLTSPDRRARAQEHDEARSDWHDEVVQREADRVSLKRFAPSGVLIGNDHRILQFRGETGGYLAPPPGKATSDVLKMARPGLMMPLRAAINRAKKDDRATRRENVKIDREGTEVTVSLEVIPLKNLKQQCFLVVFEEAGSSAQGNVVSAPPRRRAARVPRGAQARRIAELEDELSETRDYLQSMQEQQEAANEELQASNEEIESANEELQSINEELETSKEEMESSNEELSTVNEEMASRNADLRRLNSDLENVQESAHQAIVVLGRDLLIRRFNAQSKQALNLLPSDVGRSIGHIRHGLNIETPELQSFIAGVIDGVRADEREVRNRDGHWFSLRVHPYLTDDNKVDGAVVVLVDIDDLKRNEAVIADALNYADAIVQTTRDPLLILNMDLSIVSANEAFYRTFKVSKSETGTRILYDLGDGQWDIPQLRELLDDVLLHDSVFNSLEVSHDFERIGRRTMLLNARKLSFVEGHSANILLGIEDITARKEDEQTLRDSDRHKSEFLAMLAHELRSPLSSILVALQIVKRAKWIEGVDNGPAAGGNGDQDSARPVYLALQVLGRQIGQMVSLVDDLLDAARISRGKIDLRKERIDLTSLIRQVAAGANHLCERLQHRLSLDLPDAPVYVNADPTRLVQMIGNLINNACKFMAPGGHVMVNLELETQPGADRLEAATALSLPFIAIRVRDTGIGIPAEQLGRIFEMFVQVDTSLERPLSGLGIGLTLVKTLTELHGGTVEATSDGVDRGSEFIIRLPIEEVSQAPVVAPDSSDPLPVAPLRILVVDDNRDSAETMSILLGLDGHETHMAHDGMTAVEAATGLDPDVILMDIGLPGLNGYDAARRIRELRGGPGRPTLIALTGWGHEEDRRRSAEAGFDAHLVKPVDLHTLAKLLAGVGSRRHSDE